MLQAGGSAQVEAGQAGQCIQVKSWSLDNFIDGHLYSILGWSSALVSHGWSAGYTWMVGSCRIQSQALQQCLNTTMATAETVKESMRVCYDKLPAAVVSYMHTWSAGDRVKAGLFGIFFAVSYACYLPLKRQIMERKTLSDRQRMSASQLSGYALLFALTAAGPFVLNMLMVSAMPSGDSGAEFDTILPYKNRAYNSIAKNRWERCYEDPAFFSAITGRQVSEYGSIASAAAVCDTVYGEGAPSC